MQYTIKTRSTRFDVAAAWRRIAAAVADAFARWRFAHNQDWGFEPLDLHSLRDLALDRSEWGSYLVESAGEADATRRRLLDRR